MSNYYKDTENDLLAYINSTPKLYSLLCDIDLIPEQLSRKEIKKWHDMLTIAWYWETREYEILEKGEDE